MATHRKPRVPQLRFQALRGIGGHVICRDPATGTPRRHRFGITDKRREREARVLYHAWVLEHLGGANPNGHPKKVAAAKKADAPDALAGSLLDIANGLIEAERARTREGDEPRRRAQLTYIPPQGSVARVTPPDLSPARRAGPRRPFRVASGTARCAVVE